MVAEVEAVVGRLRGTGDAVGEEDPHALRRILRGGGGHGLTLSVGTLLAQETRHVEVVVPVVAKVTVAVAVAARGRCVTVGEQPAALVASTVVVGKAVP